MSAPVAHNTHGGIGRMFARQNLPSAYDAQKAVADLKPETPDEQVDRVSLSPFAPRPLPADLLRDALQTGENLSQGKSLSDTEAARLREDRVFAAVAALALLGSDDERQADWPGGFPTPTREELETARRRLAQRPQYRDETENTEQIRRQRLELMQKIGKRDLSPADFAAAGRDTAAA